MLSLTREVRYTVSLDDAAAPAPLNGLAGNLCDAAAYAFRAEVALSGEQEPRSQYLVNIQDIDRVLRQHAWKVTYQLLSRGGFTPARAVLAIYEATATCWPRLQLDSLRLFLTPEFSAAVLRKEWPMVRVRERFEFSAAHRLHNPQLSSEENVACFGKCNNVDGHGHNYEFEVEVRGPVGTDGVVLPVARLEEIVRSTVLDRFDHKHLNLQTTEFAHCIPSVENIARIVYQLLRPKFTAPIHLAQVRVWETPKTSAIYSE
jgi:6-pyruvoyltetrahydropterin/6-carboxytetrahydropterin synthase